MSKRAESLTGSPTIAWLDRPVSRAATVLLVALIVVAPGVLFFGPIGGFGRSHITRDPSAIYRLYSDDFAYVAASRTLPRTLANLFEPHNTHIVPAWRILTWVLVALAGSLVRLPLVLASAAYSILVVVMLMTARLVARETRRTGLGLAAMAAVGTTSLMASPATWYSSGQTLWAGFGILASLWYAQCWRRQASAMALGLTAISTVLACWFWTIGYLAGPVTAVYLWMDGRRRCRMAAPVPLCASVVALLAAMALGGKKVENAASFHGLTPGQAARPVAGLFHTAQAIPETLILANLGINAHTTAAQGVVITLILLGTWAYQRGHVRGFSGFNPLECAGVTLMLGSYLIEWTVRGYLPFRLLRTINLGMIVPWYDVVPQIGAVLFLVGWWSGPRSPGSRPSMVQPVRPVSRSGVIGLIGLVVALMVLHRPRVDMLWRNWVPPLTPTEQKEFPILALQSMRAHVLLSDRVEWQRRHLKRLDQAQEVASRMGIGLDGVRAAFGRLDMPELPLVYDAAGLLALPEHGRLTDPIAIRHALGPYVSMEVPPRPAWLPANEPWPPRDQPHWSESEVDDSE